MSYSPKLEYRRGSESKDISKAFNLLDDSIKNIAKFKDNLRSCNAQERSYFIASKRKEIAVFIRNYKSYFSDILNSSDESLSKEKFRLLERIKDLENAAKYIELDEDSPESINTKSTLYLIEKVLVEFEKFTLESRAMPKEARKNSIQRRLNGSMSLLEDIKSKSYPIIETKRVSYHHDRKKILGAISFTKKRILSLAQNPYLLTKKDASTDKLGELDEKLKTIESDAEFTSSIKAIRESLINLKLILNESEMGISKWNKETLTSKYSEFVVFVKNAEDYLAKNIRSGISQNENFIFLGYLEELKDSLFGTKVKLGLADVMLRYDCKEIEHELRKRVGKNFDYYTKKSEYTGDTIDFEKYKFLSKDFSEELDVLQSRVKNGNYAILIDGQRQKFYLLKKHGKDFVFLKEYAVSTGYRGFGNSEGKTTPGLHRINFALDGNFGQIIKDQRVNNVYVNDISGDLSEHAYMTTSAMYLFGLESSNDSAQSRGVALHGTNREGFLGEKKSGGCIRIDNYSAIEISDLTKNQFPGSLNYIYIDS